MIDAYNVLHTTGILPPDIAGLDLDGLIRLLGQGRYAATKVMLVCDGLPSGLSPHSERHTRARTPAAAADALTLSRGKAMQILYSGHAEADAIIEDLVAKAHRTQKPLVVSSDRRVQAAAKKRRFGILTSERFLHQLADDHAAAGRSRTVGPSPRELVPLEANLVALWAKALGFNEPMPPRGSAAPLSPAAMLRSTPLYIGGDRLPRSEPATDRASQPTPAPPASTAPQAVRTIRDADADRLIDQQLEAQVTAILRRTKSAQQAASRARPELPISASDMAMNSGQAQAATTKVRKGSKWAKHTTTPSPTSHNSAQSASPPAPPAAPELDPQLTALLRHSSDALSPADLDMTKWLALNIPPPSLPAPHGSVRPSPASKRAKPGTSPSSRRGKH